MVFRKVKKINKAFETKLIDWVEKSLEGGTDMEQIRKALIKKYGRKEAIAFIERNYPEDEETDKDEEELESELEEERKKQKEEDKLKAKMEALKAEARGEDPLEDDDEEELPKETEEEPKEAAQIEEEKQKGVPIQKMSSYDIELLNQVASINQGIMKIVSLLSKK